MGVKTVQVSGICWTDAEGRPVTEMSGRSLPESVSLKVDIPARDCSQECLEDHVVELLREMYGATAEMFYLQY